MQIPVGQGSAAGIAANCGNLSSAAGTGVGAAGVAATAVDAALTKRLPNTTASLPIVYGSIAFYLGKKADELQTHEWTLFLRGPNQADDHLNNLVISKVVFQLHPSFAQPTRELTEPPYEVTERGWGEFEAQIRIHWKDPSEQTTIVNHTIKLYPQGMPPTPSASKNDLVQQSMEKPVLAETYDEVVFTDPTESFFRSLTQITAVPPDALQDGAEETTSSFATPTTSASKTNTTNSNETTKGDDKKSRSSIANSSNAPKAPWKDHLTTGYSDQEDFLALIAAQTFLKEELAGIKQRFQHVTDEIGVVDQKLFLAQQQKQREAAAAAVRGTGSSTATGGESRKRTKKSRSTSSQNKRPRTSGGSSGKSSASGASTTAAGSSKRATTPSRAGGGSAAARTGAKSASKAASGAAATTAAATKRGNANSSRQSSIGANKKVARETDSQRN